MDKIQIALLVILVGFVVTTMAIVWLVKRAKPEKRIHWFIGCSVITIFLLGIIPAPIAILASLGIFALIKKEDDNPLQDIGRGVSTILGSGFYLVFYAFYILLGIGGIYWLWLAIQLKSFAMFLVGVFPLSFIVTIPVGAYSLVFGTPEWVLSWFG
ncbi:hypothetical protein CI610_02816 [invertebrate metagenome]|uniref:Uncharacterized protein n=1 Tax=invertebrate metagenome TaxID=1711999 RepID=A0A2H9T4W2_9ZZZZ